MVRPGLRGKGKVKRRTPGGALVVRYTQRHSSPECGRCGILLAGTAKGSSSEVRAMKHSERMPSRMYAGVLCADCVDSMVRYVARMETKHSNPEFSVLELSRDLTIEKFLPADWWASVQKGGLLWNKEKTFERKAAKKTVKESKPVEKKAKKPEKKEVKQVKKASSAKKIKKK